MIVREVGSFSDTLYFPSGIRAFLCITERKREYRMSLFTSFNSGVSGLKASQAGMNTAAHNLANTKTTGYTRQQNILRILTIPTSR